MDVKIAGCPPGLAPVSLVLTVRNSAADLPDLLESIGRQQLLPSELLIVDLGSTDTTLEVLRSWRPPAGTVLKVIESPRASIAQGRNLAIETASFDHIAVTHGAVRLHTEWLSRLWMALADGADLVSGDIRPAGKHPAGADDRAARNPSGERDRPHVAPAAQRVAGLLQGPVGRGGRLPGMADRRTGRGVRRRDATCRGGVQPGVRSARRRGVHGNHCAGILRPVFRIPGRRGRPRSSPAANPCEPPSTSRRSSP